MADIIPAYHYNGPAYNNSCEEIICLYGKHYETGGLADRLRGLVAAYEISMDNNIGFKIWWNQPFSLCRFLEPNDVDWLIDDSKICWSMPETYVLSAEITEESMWQEQHIRSLINKTISTVSCRQLHIYTNMRLTYEDGSFSRLFNKLFKISKELRSAINDELEKIGNDYISIQCRFMGLLGDFIDINNDILSDSEQQNLMDMLINKIDEIHNKQNNKMPVLLCTDSPKFRSMATKRLSYIYAISGDIKHIDFISDRISDAYMKVFLDLFMMSNANCIYRLATRQMRLSGLPYMASLLGNKELKDILI